MGCTLLHLVQYFMSSLNRSEVPGLLGILKQASALPPPLAVAVTFSWAFIALISVKGREGGGRRVMHAAIR